MIIHFKNGYSVRVTDCKGKSKKEILDAATFAMRTTKEREAKTNDATLTRNIETNVSFRITRLKEALKNAKETGDMKNVEKEIGYLERDLAIDASENHKNYINMYRPEVIRKIIDQYQKAIGELVKSGVVEEKTTERLSRILERIKENWNIKENVEDAVAETDELDMFYEELDNRRIPYKFVSGGYGIEFEKDRDFRIAQKIAQKYNVPKLEWRPEERRMYEYSSVRYGMDVEDKDIKDVPYFQPTDYPKIDSPDYSIDRIKKELRHNDREGTLWKNEIEEVFSEIDEFIEGGSELLISAGWSKDDARHAIEERYEDLAKELRRAKETEYYNRLRSKVKELKKAWDLIR